MLVVDRDWAPGSSWELQNALTVADAGTWIGMDRASAYAAANSGQLPCYRYAGRLYVLKEDVFRMMSERASR